jgi:hypothetical protein
MRKLILLSALALAATPALAIDDDLLGLTGTIDYQCDVTMLGGATATVNMALSASQTVAQVRYICNDPDGFWVKTKSAHGGKLKSGTYSREYTATMSGGDVPGINYGPVGLSSSPPPTNVSGFQVGAADPGGSVHDFAITLDLSGPALPGGLALTDSIVFSVEGL